MFALRQVLNVTKLHCYKVTVIHEAQNLRIRGLDVTVRLN